MVLLHYIGLEADRLDRIDMTVSQFIFFLSHTLCACPFKKKKKNPISQFNLLSILWKCMHIINVCRCVNQITKRHLFSLPSVFYYKWNCLEIHFSWFVGAGIGVLSYYIEICV